MPMQHAETTPHLARIGGMEGLSACPNNVTVSNTEATAMGNTVALNDIAHLPVPERTESSDEQMPPQFHIRPDSPGAQVGTGMDYPELTSAAMAALQPPIFASHTAKLEYNLRAGCVEGRSPLRFADAGGGKSEHH